MDLVLRDPPHPCNSPIITVLNPVFLVSFDGINTLQKPLILIHGAIQEAAVSELARSYECLLWHVMLKKFNSFTRFLSTDSHPH